MTDKIFLSAHTIELRVPTLDDISSDMWCNWYNDQQLTRYNSHGVFPINQEQEVQYHKEKAGDGDTIVLAIFEKKNNRLVGNASIQKIDWINRHCEIALTIGEEASVSAGVEVFGLLAQHAFDRLNLNCVRGITHEKLASFVSFLSVLGFVIEGRWRQYYHRESGFSDVIHFSLLKQDYQIIVGDRGKSFLYCTHDELLGAIKATHSPQ